MATIKTVDGTDPVVGGLIEKMHREVFPDDFTLATAVGYWWLAYGDHLGKKPIGFAGLYESTKEKHAGYLCRCGVLEKHRGLGLQRRFIRVRERKARVLGWSAVVTDTTDNVPSANNLIASGYRLFVPEQPWANAGALYWRKRLA